MVAVRKAAADQLPLACEAAAAAAAKFIISHSDKMGQLEVMTVVSLSNKYRGSIEIERDSLKMNSKIAQAPPSEEAARQENDNVAAQIPEN